MKRKKCQWSDNSRKKIKLQPMRLSSSFKSNQAVNTISCQIILNYTYFLGQVSIHSFYLAPVFIRKATTHKKNSTSVAIHSSKVEEINILHLYCCSRAKTRTINKINCWDSSLKRLVLVQFARRKHLFTYFFLVTILRWFFNMNSKQNFVIGYLLVIVNIYGLNSAAEKRDCEIPKIYEELGCIGINETHNDGCPTK